MSSSSVMPPLNRFQHNVHSQNGEDGVVKEILSRLGIKHQGSWCVEFGAWDGIHLSNTFSLVEQGWNAVYIEGEPQRYSDLFNTAKKFPQITPVQAFVARHYEDNTSLNKLLERTAIPEEFDLLSIDIDSYDCDVWESLVRYRPKIVIIEINSAVPPGIIWRHSPKTPSNTFSATLNVGIKKGYTLVCHTGNLFFVRNDLIGAINLPQRYLDYPELLFLYDSPWLPANLFQPALRRAAAFIPEALLPLARKVKSMLG